MPLYIIFVNYADYSIFPSFDHDRFIWVNRPIFQLLLSKQHFRHIRIHAEFRAFRTFCEDMQDVRRPAQYTEYPRKSVAEEEEPLNIFSIASLICGLIAVIASV